MDSINGISYYLNKCYTLSNTSQMITFSFKKTAHRGIVHVTQTNWAKMWFLCFPVLPGSAEVQVIGGGIVRRLLIAYFIGNISAKKYQNPFMCVNVIASQKWYVFLKTVCHMQSVWLDYNVFCGKFTHRLFFHGVPLFIYTSLFTKQVAKMTKQTSIVILKNKENLTVRWLS